MTIVDELLSSLNCNGPVRDICQGAFQTAVWTRTCGLASTPHDPGSHHSRFAVGSAGLLLERCAGDVALMAKSSSQNEAAIGMACINSLLEVKEQDCVELNAGDLLMQKGENRRVAIIGHFPFVPALRKVAKELWVIEKNLHEGDVPESEAGSLLPQADVVGITGSAFINNTIDSLLKMTSSKAYVVVLGGTAPLSSILFDHGVNAVSGTLVIDPECVLLYVSQGATFRQIEGVRLLTMQKQ